MKQVEAPPGDQVRASVFVAVPQKVAFTLFTEHIDSWWRKGLRYRALGRAPSVIHLEAKLGGRLFEAASDDAGTSRVIETGTITLWEPPSRFVFAWRSVTFVPGESTEVCVTFEEKPRGTLVTVTHRGWANIREDHPVRHGASVAAFIRTMGLWWGDLLTALRERATPPANGDEP